jgi:hypothetical protein
LDAGSGAYPDSDQIILSKAFWFIPQALGLMRDTGVGLTPAENNARAQAWLSGTKCGFAGILAVFVLTLMALIAPPMRTHSTPDDQKA